MASAGGAAGLALGCWALAKSSSALRRQHNRMHLAMAVTASIWLLYFLSSSALDLLQVQQKLHVFIALFVYQTLLVSVSFLLLVSAGVGPREAFWMLLFHAGAGGAALYGARDELSQTDAQAVVIAAYESWIASNLLAAALVTTAIGYRVYQSPNFPGWFALGGCFIGLGAGLDSFFAGQTTVPAATFAQCSYAAYLLLLSYLSAWHGESVALSRASTPQFGRSTGFEQLSGFGPSDDAATLAVASERRRIAQDLHDGVGSQIVNILASLDTRAAYQREEVTLALEQCLMDLKMTVDAIDSADDNVPEALGRLRHRLQHSLDNLGIELAWKVEICKELQAVRGMVAQQVLKIAQESLANVMRHAKASAVEVVCRVVAEPSQLVLDVRDNGLGITRAEIRRRAGKGLQNMHRRAETAGGTLVISSKLGVGTRVRLIIPMR